MLLLKMFSCLKLPIEDNICKLDYSNNVLSDCFPNVWQYERTLEELNITSAKINYLPPELFLCQGLKVLLASNNNIENIPESVGALRKLQKLNMNRNFISNVPESITCCKNLTHLDLSCNNLQKLPDAITCLISLQELLLNDTCLEFLPANFGRLINLKIIELRSNNLASLPKSMYRLKNLIRLDIGCNDFTILPEIVGELQQLHELWFDLNQIQHFPPFLGKLRNLEHCEANGNCFKSIPLELGECRNLELLSLSTNALNKLFSNVGLLKSLVTLKCENNVLTDLPDSISMLECLEELNVSHNMLKSLPNAIGLLRRLRYLFADENNLQSIPNEICSCSALSILSISYNQILELPSNLGHLRNLKVLNIVENNISSLPVTVLSLTNLKSLWISCNQSKPLIPLQYKDITRKSELTCFMLPQLTAKFDQMFGFNPESFEEQPVNMLTKRRICFAEQTTILSSKKQPFTTTNSSSNRYEKSTHIAKNLSETVSCLKSTPLEDFLERSPTPYPNELRLMAQLLQENHNILNSDYIHNAGTKSANFNTQSVISVKTRIPKLSCTSELYQNKSNEKQNITIFNKKDIQNIPEIIQSLNDYQINFEKNHNTTSNQMPLAEFYYKSAEGNSYEEKHEAIANEYSDKKILPYKCKVLPNEVHCLNSNSISTNDIKKSGNKWLFGVHKNLRVLQVQIIWENGCDITVNFLPNKEGIYVINIVPNTNASKTLLPYDKLLEVDGTDFTCISLDEARQILCKPRPIINILLSR